MNSKINSVVKAVYDLGYCISEGFFEAEAIDSLLSLLNIKQNKLTSAGIGKRQNFIKAPEIRSDKILWIDRGDDSTLDKLFFPTIEELILQLNRRCFLGLNSFEFHFAMYEPGAFYKKHRDSFSNDDARKITVILYLNKNWKEGDGGELELYTQDNKLTVQPKSGTLVVFESNLEHEVLPGNKNRYSITGWLKNTKNIF